MYKTWPQKPPNKGKLVPGAGKESVERKTRKIEETKNQFMRITNNALENCNNLELQLVSSLLSATKSTAADGEGKEEEGAEEGG